MELYIMRHGQTADNKKHLLQGRKNIPLSEEGIEQALKAKAQQLSRLLPPLSLIFTTQAKLTRLSVSISSLHFLLLVSQ